MPSRSLKPCTYPGCHVLTPTGRCSAHPIQRNKVVHRLYDRAWRKRASDYLAAHPLCEDCDEQGKVVPSVDVHHTLPHRGDPDRFKNSPLRALCKACHARHTRREQAGGG
ncbi:MAG: HNH endonuclease [Chloroflexi bacterium HGW-Chloroflexi-6]|nr:MAG: HNH endonuclease [Chloroflexi bacterium HGW-Chloroflexi-6]